MEEKKTAIVLGGTVPHGEILQKLRKKGYRTILIDYFENPPAAKYADIHIKESAMDHDAVLMAAKKYEAELVMSPCLDQQMNIAIKVDEELGLKHPFSSEVAHNVTNKSQMKAIMIREGIPTARHYVVCSDSELDNLRLDYPIIVKPEDNCGSAGVYKLESGEGLSKTVAEVEKWSLSGKVIVEEYNEGTEMSVHCYIKDGNVNILFGTCKVVGMENGLYQQLVNLYIPNLRPGLKKGLEEVAVSIKNAFRIPDNTPFFMQVVVKGDKISVIEFSPRVAGGVASYVSEEYTNFSLLDFAISSYTGEFQSFKEHSELKKYIYCLPLYADAGIFVEVRGAEELIKQGVVKKMLLLKEPLDHISSNKPSSSNVMKYIIEGDTPEECFDKIIKAKKSTDIIGDGNRSILKQDYKITKDLFEEKIKELM